MGSCRREGPGGRRGQSDEVAVGIAHLRQRRIVALDVVPEHDPQALQPAALGLEIVDVKETPRPAISSLLESISPPWSNSSHCTKVSIGR